MPALPSTLPAHEGEHKVRPYGADIRYQHWRVGKRFAKPISRGWEILGDIHPFQHGVTGLVTLAARRASPKLEQAAQDSAYADGLQQLAEVTPFEPETDTAAERLSLQRFGSGEPVLTQGERGEALDLILAGRVAMTFEGAGGTVREVLRLSQGELFGASALLRGEPSVATFTTLEDVETVTLSPDAVVRMAERRPSFARALEELIETRSQAVETMKRQPLPTDMSPPLTRGD